MSRTPDTPHYRERLSVPLRWWVQGTMLIATLWLALVVAVPAVVAWSVTAFLLALLAAGLNSYGTPEIRVTGGELLVGRAHISSTYLGLVESLDADQARRAAGVEADARAYLVLRPYLARAVRVAITDPEDPAPYWLISTRHPDELAAALAVMTRGPGSAR
ncbi:MAG: DUF3093 domain-containing protein [Nocardioides sp.]